ncbi:MAG: methyltransferase domain-containing protein [Alphaproteobacteria bacterium]|nr:methyltransferase domain-containing protein [Alphaproteobacteria bacterium]
MLRNAYDFRNFYRSIAGRIMRRVLQTRLLALWPHGQGLRIAGCGYAVPYLSAFRPGSERIIALMPATLGIHAWPVDQTNLAAFSHDDILPLESASVDRVLLVHGLEFADHPVRMLKEIWRVLKSTGRLIVIVPSRTGLWTRAEWTPFGLGAPFTGTQLSYVLRESGFVTEHSTQGLFVPPLRLPIFLRLAQVIERFGQRFLPMLGGVHIIEASKQIYARAEPGGGSRVSVGAGFIPRPVGAYKKV